MPSVIGGQAKLMRMKYIGRGRALFFDRLCYPLCPLSGMVSTLWLNPKSDRRFASSTRCLRGSTRLASLNSGQSFPLGAGPAGPRNRGASYAEEEGGALFDSLCLAGLSASYFTRMAQKSFWSERGHADHPVRPTVVVASITTIGGQRGKNRRGQDRRYQSAREGQRDEGLRLIRHRAGAGTLAHALPMPSRTAVLHLPCR